MTVAAQRTGPLSRLVFYPETTFDTDPGSPAGWVVPLAAASASADSQARVPAPFYDGTTEPESSFAGAIQFGGSDNVNLEFGFSGAMLKSFWGSGGYAHVTGSKLHQYLSGYPQGSCQLQREWTETTAQFIRGRGVRISKWNPKYTPNQPTVYSLDVMGLGDMTTTDLAGTKTVVCPNPVSPFYGFLKLDGTTLATVTAFDLSFDMRDQRQEAAFNQGIAAAVNQGKLKADVTLTLIFDSTSNLNTYTQAVNDHQFTLECEWADLPGELATQWLRLVMPKVKLPRPAINVGGNNGLVQQFKGTVEFDCNTGRAAECYAGQTTVAGIKASVASPIVITLATNDTLKVTIDGGSPQTVTIPAASYTSMAALAAAVPSITGATVDSFNGFLRVTSLTTGTTSQVQFGTVANSAYASLGLDTVLHTGVAPHAVYVDLQNGQTASY